MQIWLNQGLVRRIFQFSVSNRNNHYGTTNDNVKYIPEILGRFKTNITTIFNLGPNQTSTTAICFIKETTPSYFVCRDSLGPMDTQSQIPKLHLSITGMLPHPRAHLIIMLFQPSQCYNIGSYQETCECCLLKKEATYP